MGIAIVVIWSLFLSVTLLHVPAQRCLQDGKGCPAPVTQVKK